MAYRREKGHKVATWITEKIWPGEYEVIGEFDGVWMVGKNVKVNDDVLGRIERNTRYEAARRLKRKSENIKLLYLPTFGVKMNQDKFVKK